MDYYKAKKIVKKYINNGMTREPSNYITDDWAIKILDNGVRVISSENLNTAFLLNKVDFNNLEYDFQEGALQTISKIGFVSQDEYFLAEDTIAIAEENQIKTRQLEPINVYKNIDGKEYFILKKENLISTNLCFGGKIRIEKSSLYGIHQSVEPDFNFFTKRRITTSIYSEDMHKYCFQEKLTFSDSKLSEIKRNVLLSTKSGACMNRFKDSTKTRLTQITYDFRLDGLEKGNITSLSYFEYPLLYIRKGKPTKDFEKEFESGNFYVQFHRSNHNYIKIKDIDLFQKMLENDDKKFISDLLDYEDLISENKLDGLTVVPVMFIGN